MPEPDEISVFLRGMMQLEVAYMITGATAAIIYGQPRVTNDLDLVVALDASAAEKISTVFPSDFFYAPPLSVIQTEMARSLRGHFNLIHHESGYKADIYLVGNDPLHAWALPLRRWITWSDELSIAVAPPEYVILRKLEYYREGGSSKHPADIRAILSSTSTDRNIIQEWTKRLGLEGVWEKVKSA